MQTVAARNEHPAGAAPQAFSPHARPLPDGFLPLEVETREVLPTADAARHLLRQPQTLRGWACLDNGPIRPRAHQWPPGLAHR